MTNPYGHPVGCRCGRCVRKGKAAWAKPTPRKPRIGKDFAAPFVCPHEEPRCTSRHQCDVRTRLATKEEA